jgi:hypothetical protein
MNAHMLNRTSIETTDAARLAMHDDLHEPPMHFTTNHLWDSYLLE